MQPIFIMEYMVLELLIKNRSELIFMPYSDDSSMSFLTIACLSVLSKVVFNFRGVKSW